MRLRLAIAIALVVTALGCAAQDTQQQATTPSVKPPAAKSSTQPTGTLTGMVYCSDTNLPARTAAVYLVPISQNFAGDGGFGASTDLEGRFVLNHLPDGDYYVVATMPGYVNLRENLLQSHLDAMTAEDRESFLAQLQRATISGGQSSQMSIGLERGAEIDGTVTYDDGSPAIGLHVVCQQKVGQERDGVSPKMMEDQCSRDPEMGRKATDDNGHFRIFGISPGEYVVSVSVSAYSAELTDENRELDGTEPSFTGVFRVYTGDVLRADKAETITVTAGGASKDVDITIPLNRLHTIRGHVLLKSTGQPPPSATVQLVYADTKEPERMALAQGGEFVIRYVPEDSFILQAIARSKPISTLPDQDDDSGVASVPTPETIRFVPDAGQTEGFTEMPLLIAGDIDSITITVADPQPAAAPAGASSPESAQPGNSAPTDNTN